MEGKDGRTERATPKKRRKERRKGNLCMSQEVMSMAVLLMGVISLRIAFPGIYHKIEVLLRMAFSFEYIGDWNPKNVSEWSRAAFVFLGFMLAPVLVPVMSTAVITSMAQTRPYFSMEAFKFKLSALNPVKGIKKLFSLESLMKLGLSLLKIGFIVFTVWLLTRRQIPVFSSLSHFPNAGSVLWMSGLIFRICIVVLCLFVVVAVLDWCHKKYKHEQNLMMTKQEVKDERKQEELSPLVKKQQFKKMREFNFMRMIAAVPQASVVITNPTHIAVALEYDPETMSAPKVTAKGMRLVAERIKKIAIKHNIPIVERPAMARSLYKYVKVGRFIPVTFYEAVAEVLAFLHRIGRGVKIEG